MEVKYCHCHGKGGLVGMICYSSFMQLQRAYATLLLIWFCRLFSDRGLFYDQPLFSCDCYTVFGDKET